MTMSISMTVSFVLVNPHTSLCPFRLGYHQLAMFISKPSQPTSSATSEVIGWRAETTDPTLTPNDNEEMMLMVMMVLGKWEHRAAANHTMINESNSPYDGN